MQKPSIVINLFLFIFCCNLTQAKALFIYGGTSQGSKVYLCKMSSSGRLTPGVARDQNGSSWRSIAQRISAINNNRNISSQAKSAKIKLLKQIARQVRQACESQTPSATPPQQNVLIGEWQSSYSCADTLGLGCLENILFQFHANGTYVMTLNGSRFCWLESYSGYQYQEATMHYLQVTGRYSIDTQARLTLTQQSDLANWGRCPIIGTRIIPEGRSSFDLHVFDTRVYLSADQQSFTLDPGCAFVSSGLHFCGLYGLQPAPFVKIG